MQYMLLIYNDELEWQRMADADREKVIGEYFAYTDELRNSGAYVAGDPLQPTATAKTVRLQDGERLVTDGPFAETKEQLGGYYLVDVESEDDAVAWAAKIPAARYGRIEVRPVLQIPERAEA